MSLRRTARLLAAVVGSAAGAAQADAQADAQARTPAASQASKRTCFRGRPAASCRAFWLTEGGYYWRLGGTEFVDTAILSRRRQHLGAHTSWEIGGMVNRGRTLALGGTLLLGHDSRGPRLAVKGRYRRWLPGEATVDVSAGLLKATASRPWPHFPVNAYGPTADVSLGWADLIAATVRMDVLYASGERTVSGVYAGLRLGSYPAVVVTAALATYAAILVGALLGGGGDF